MSSKPFPEELSELHQQLVEAQQASKRQQEFFDHLSTVEEKLKDHEEWLEQLLRRKHTEEEREDAEQRQAELTLAKRELDHELDIIGDDLDETIEELQQQLIDAVLALYPHEKEEYQGLVDALDAEIEIHRTVRELQGHCTELEAQLEAAVTLRHRRRNTFFQFLFGRNPRSLTYLQLRDATDHAREMQASLEESLDNMRASPLTKLFEKVHTIVIAVKTAFPDVYSHRQFDSTIPQILEELKAVLLEMQKTINQQDEDILRREAELEKWIVDRVA